MYLGSAGQALPVRSTGMHLCVLSPPETLYQEITLVNQLFEAGLTHYHMRKPGITPEAQQRYLDAITPAFLSAVVIHQHHHLRKQYPLMGIHFRENDRKTLLNDSETSREAYLERVGNIDGTTSTSIHTFEDLEKEATEFDYVFLSPVFESISKKGYGPSTHWDVNHLKGQSRPRRIALGGIDESRVSSARALGFEAVAVLGAVWKDTTNVMFNFRKILKKCQEVGSLS